MEQIDKEQFGQFVAALRKEHGMTQKDLAERLHVSDKAVSKWERGLSLPDISLLTPLAEALEVTVTELLRGGRAEEKLPLQEVERLVTGSMELSAQARPWQKGKGAILLYALCLAVAGAELLALRAFGITWAELERHQVLLAVGMNLLFGGWFCLFAKDRLPWYYDQDRISAYSDGPFRMNLPGVEFNNRNWPYIVRAGRNWTLTVSLALPVAYLVCRRVLFPTEWRDGPWLAFVLIATLSMLAAMTVAGKRHQS